MTSSVPKFCAKCFQGTLRGDLEPTGTVETIHRLPTYVARPDPPAVATGIVVIIPDAFGWELRNTRALADSYARRIPAVVLLPDLMAGHAFPINLLPLSDEIAAESTTFARRNFVLKPKFYLSLAYHYIPFLTSLRPPITLSRLQTYLSALKAEPPAPFTPSTPSKIGVAGFCWGGKYAILLCHPPDPGNENPVTCAFTAHPSLVDVPREINPIALPLSLANGVTDEWMTGEKVAEFKRVLDIKGNCETRLYDGATHGFAVRGDPNDERQARFGMEAEDQAVAWYKKHFEAVAEGSN